MSTTSKQSKCICEEKNKKPQNKDVYMMTMLKLQRQCLI